MSSITNGTHTATEQKWFCLAGLGVGHSISPSVHNTVTKALGLPWTFKLLECPSIEFLMDSFKQPDFAAGVVTMPYKKTIIPHLDEIDDRVKMLGSCNNVYLKPSEDGNGRPKLCGSNTDWIGVLECLRSKSTKGVGKPALVIGAGGASRAAVYALFKHLDCPTIYIINRDEQEVADLYADAKAYGASGPTIVHVQSIEQAAQLESPFYVVGTVPDFEPVTESEKRGFAMLRQFFQGAMKDGDGEKGVFLDMCFNPRITRFLKLAQSLDWTTVEGWNVIGWQAPEQFRLWVGEERSRNIDMSEVSRNLVAAAESSPIINRTS